MNEDIVFAQVIDVKEDHVEAVVALKPGFLQVRRFPGVLLKNFELNDFFKIVMTIEPGKQTITVERVTADISHMFVKENVFKDFDGSFFKEG